MINASSIIARHSFRSHVSRTLGPIPQIHFDDDRVATTMEDNDSPPAALPPEISAALADAKARGLPDGWTCSIDVRITLYN